jgi:hypothetical protein
MLSFGVKYAVLRNSHFPPREACMGKRKRNRALEEEKEMKKMT